MISCRNSWIRIGLPEGEEGQVKADKWILRDAATGHDVPTRDPPSAMLALDSTCSHQGVQRSLAQANDTQATGRERSASREFPMTKPTELPCDQ